MTNSVVAEIYDLAERALKSGQERVNVHVFPFRMTDENMAKYAKTEFMPFWQNLKEGYDAFEQTQVPPHIGVCEKRYLVEPTGPEEVAAQSPLAVCGGDLAAISAWEQVTPLVQRRLSRLSRPQPSLAQETLLASSRLYPHPRLSRQASLLPHPSLRPQGAFLFPGQPQPGNAAKPETAAVALPPTVTPQCDLKLASCRKWLDLQNRVVAKAFAMRDGQPLPGPRRKTAARSR
jgi:hypothetical protein